MYACNVFRCLHLINNFNNNAHGLIININRFGSNLCRSNDVYFSAKIFISYILLF